MKRVSRIMAHVKKGTLCWAILLRLLQPFRWSLFSRRVKFRMVVGYWPHFRRPRTINEKIHWLKLYHNDPRVACLRNKLLVRDYVKRVAPDLRIPEVFFATDNPALIRFDELPEKCVIKSTFGDFARHVLFFDRGLSDPEAVREQCRQWLDQGRAGSRKEYRGAAPPYMPKVFGEQLLIDKHGYIPRDVKIWVMNAHARYVQVVRERFSDSGPAEEYYDTLWNRLSLKREGYRTGSGDTPPRRLHYMVEVAERLADKFPLVRVDLYEIDDVVYFGEMTFYPGAGYRRFEPTSYDFEFGAQLALPTRSASYPNGSHNSEEL